MSDNNLLARIWRRWYGRGDAPNRPFEWNASVLIDDLRGLTPPPTTSWFSGRASATAVVGVPSGHRLGFTGTVNNIACIVKALWCEPGGSQTANTFRVGVGRAGKIFTDESDAFGGAIVIPPYQRVSRPSDVPAHATRSARDAVIWPQTAVPSQVASDGTSFVPDEAQLRWYVSGASGADATEIDGAGGADLSNGARFPVTGNMVATGGTATDRIQSFAPFVPLPIIWPGDFLYVIGTNANVQLVLNLIWAEVPVDLVQGVLSYGRHR